MEVPVDTYNSNNDAAKHDAIMLVNEIKSKEENLTFDLVVDVGSGSGNVTTILADKISFKRLIGLDIDKKMVEFAKEANKNPNIDYLECDIQAQWDQQPGGVKQLQNQCSLVFSNYTIHWLTDIPVCVDNLNRLLMLDGRVFLLTIPPEYFFPLDSRNRQFELLIPLIKNENFIDAWIKALKSSGFVIEKVELKEIDKQFTKQFLDNLLIPMREIWLKKHGKNAQINGLVEQHKSLLAEQLFDSMKKVDDSHWLSKHKNLIIVAKKIA